MPDLPTAVARHRHRAPEEPALFYPEGLDVRWRSWRALWDQVAGGAAALGAAGLAPGAPVAFRWRPHPDAVAADLAIQAAGGVAVPVTDPATADSSGFTAGCQLWLRQPEEPAPPGERRTVPLPEARPPWERSPRVEPGELPVPGGGARVLRDPGMAGLPAGAGDAAGGRAWRDRSAAELLAEAEELAARLDPASLRADAVPGGRRPRREIAVASFDLQAPDARAFLGRSLLAGTALLLEPDPRALPGSAGWARPTLVAAEAAPLIGLARWIRRQSEGRLRRLRRRARPRRPFGRLRVLVLLGPGRLPLDDVSLWAERGVALVRAARP